jgi:hypothetical protein
MTNVQWTSLTVKLRIFQTLIGVSSISWLMGLYRAIDGTPILFDFIAVLLVYFLYPWYFVQFIFAHDKYILGGYIK